MTERFDAAAARAGLGEHHATPHHWLMAARTIAYAALDELDRRDKEAEERQVTDDGRLKYRGCKPNEHGEWIPIPDGEAEEPPATDDTVFEEWWKENEHEPYTDKTWAMLGWLERGRRAEAELHERLDELNTRWQEELDRRDTEAEIAEATEQELRTEIEKLKDELLDVQTEKDQIRGVLKRKFAEIEKLTTQHSLDAETVCKVHGEYKELETRLQAALQDAANRLDHRRGRIEELQVEIERLRAIIANITAAVLSYGPSQPLRDTNLSEIACDAVLAATE